MFNSLFKKRLNRKNITQNSVGRWPLHFTSCDSFNSEHIALLKVRGGVDLVFSGCGPVARFYQFYAIMQLDCITYYSPSSPFTA